MLANTVMSLDAGDILSATWQLFSKALSQGFLPTIRSPTLFSPYLCSIIQFNRLACFLQFARYWIRQWRGFKTAVQRFKLILFCNFALTIPLLSGVTPAPFLQVTKKAIRCVHSLDVDNLKRKGFYWRHLSMTFRISLPCVWNQNILAVCPVIMCLSVCPSEPSLIFLSTLKFDCVCL